MGYLNKFATQAAYDTEKYDLDYPAISYVSETGAFKFDKQKPLCTFNIMCDTPKAIVFINGSQRSSISATQGSSISWQVSCPGRVAQSGTYILTKDHTENVTLEPLANGVYIKYTDFSYSAYNSLESGKTPLGVTLKTNACALTLLPDEGSSKEWGPARLLIGPTTTMDYQTAIEDYSGRLNTVRAINSGLSVEAFSWAAQYPLPSVVSDIAWLPSCGEMGQIMLNATNINTALALIGGTAIDFSDGIYWSSTQYDSTRAWGWSAHESLHKYYNKSYSFNCRAVTTI